MSLLQNSFLEVPLKNALALYNKEVIPRLTKKNKIISISVAVALSLIYLIREKVLKPPKHLRHIPYISYLDSVKAILTRESAWDRSYRVFLPEIDQKNHSIFLEQARLGWIVHVANPKDARRVFLKIDQFPKLQPKIEHKDTVSSKFLGGPNILMLNGPEWKKHRMVANPAFHRSLPVKMFGKLTQDMIKVMDKMEGTINISDLLHRWTLEAIGKAGFDFEFNAIKDRDSEWIIRYNKINQGLRDPKFFFFPLLDSKWRWMFPGRNKIHQELDIFLKMLDDVIAKKKEAIKHGLHNKVLDDNEKDLLTLMIESEELGEGGLNNEELKSTLCIFFLAGHDTTAGALSFAVHYLAQNQDIQQKAREEAIRILGDDKCDVLPTVEQTKEMTYINQIIKETLRINGPATRIIPRISTEDAEFSGLFIPKGTQVTVNIFAIQHSEKVWKDAHIFNPDRFEDGGEASQVESMAWTPFGNGARQCIGMNFSMSEQRVMLAMLLRKYTWKTPENSIHKDGPKVFGLGILSPHNLDIDFQKRY
ncbi:cytochrome P450 [Mucor mucedo]|uniref:cytochrome P450 n=1 Tax=Mucor mucedo TaxID=29922 RepID=UPI00221E8831|nr:cytochrome P450 [Mucor mucedo]KAI7893584.1 cytochrome P450 [Mucor mucedo]